MRCPKCGGYMSSQVLPDYCGGWVQIWSCLCGYYEPNNNLAINTDHTLTETELQDIIDTQTSNERITKYDTQSEI